MDIKHLQQQSVYDLNSLNELRSDALSHSSDSEGGKKALRQAAEQFESIFMQMLLKSMRKANAAFEDENSPFNASSVKYFQDMHDQQLSSELSKNGSLGLADIIVQQLSVNDSGYLPASALRTEPLASSQKSTVQTSSDIAPATAQKQQTEQTPSQSEQPKFNSSHEFVEGVWDYAKKAAQKIGAHPALMVAQAALETGWGQHIIKTASGQSSNNVFNIKAHRDWDGSSTVKSTLEYEGGVAVQKKEPFRVYDSIAQSFDDFVEFLQSNPRYQKALDVASNPAQFLDELQAAGYATDPNYSNKIKRLLGQSEFQAVAPKLLGQGE